MQWVHNDVNRDFNLKGYLYHYSLWGPISDPVMTKLFKILQQNRWPLFLLICISFLLIHGFMVRKKQKFQLWELMLVGGYSIALEIIFILEYQILFGTIYSTLTIIFGLFMLGLALGVTGHQVVVKKFPAEQLERSGMIGFIILALSLLVPVFLLPTGGFSDFLATMVKWGLASLFIFMNGFLTGGYFSLLTSRYYTLAPSSSAGISYGFDLAGSLLAAFMVSIFMVPLFEIKGVLLILVFVMTVQLLWRVK
jgi:hypothetical protein